MKFAACSFLALALSLPVQAAQWPYELKPGEKLDEESGVVIRSERAVASQPSAGHKALQNKAVTCSITFSPNPISNSQTSFYSTNYGGTGCVAGNIVETVTFNWNSIVSYYGEFTQQKKTLQITSGCLAGSGHVVAAPTGLGINGPTTAQLEVRDWPGNNLICTATGTLTVN